MCIRDREHAQFAGNCYGTPREAVEQNLEKGIDVVLEIEVQGALQVKQKCPDALLVFVSLAKRPALQFPAPVSYTHLCGSLPDRIKRSAIIRRKSAVFLHLINIL